MIVSHVPPLARVVRLELCPLHTHSSNKVEALIERLIAPRASLALSGSLEEFWSVAPSPYLIV